MKQAALWTEQANIQYLRVDLIKPESLVEPTYDAAGDSIRF